MLTNLIASIVFTLNTNVVNHAGYYEDPCKLCGEIHHQVLIKKEQVYKEVTALISFGSKEYPAILGKELVSERFITNIQPYIRLDFNPKFILSTNYTFQYN